MNTKTKTSDKAVVATPNDALQGIVENVNKDHPIAIQQDVGMSPIVEKWLSSKQEMTVEVVQAIAQLQKDHEKDEARKSFYLAMAHARSEMGPAIKGSTNNHIGYDYANLDDQIEAARPALSKYGISYSFELDQSVAMQVTATCVMAHALGHEVRYPATFPVDPPKSPNTAAQMVGIAITYAKRQAFNSATGMATTHDTDGQEPSPVVEKSVISPGQASELVDLLTAIEEIEDGFSDRWRNHYLDKYDESDSPAGVAIHAIDFKAIKKELEGALKSRRAKQGAE